jgi:hypothetical protein
MSKALGLIVGAALVGAAVMLRPKTAAASPEDPGPAPSPPSEPSDTPAPIPDPLPASGNSEFPPEERRELLPSELRDIDLSGQEKYQAFGEVRMGGGGPDGKSFYKWYVHDSLNGMPLILYVGVDHPEDWIAFFDHEDGAGSIPPSHSIIYKISESPNKDWMTHVLANL